MGTILKVNGKTKDNIKARLDLQRMGIRKDLWATRTGDKYRVPNASYVMSNKEKDSFCKLLREIKVPDGYASNISRCVNLKERRLIGLKSHDCHVLLEHLLPIAIRGNLPDDVCEAVTELFRKDIPPIFFVVMMHLPIHLVEQAKVGGPVQYCWMYPIERYLRKLKRYVRNKAHPEGSMAKGQIIEESLVLIERHMNSVVTKFNQLGRNEDNTRFQSAVNKLSVFRQSGEFQGKKRVASFSEEEFQQMKLAVLKNCDERTQIYLEGTSHAHRKHTEEFPRWFERKIYQLHKETSQVSEELLSLAGGPCREALSFNIYTVNGYRFQTKRWEQGRTTQNAGVCVTIEKDYFGVLTDIIELRYVGGFRVVLFKCDWRDVDSDRGCRKDKHGVVTAVNRTVSCWQDEPYVLPSQVSQVMYVNEGEESQWQTVIKLKPRNYYDMPVRDINTDLSPSEAAQDLYSAYSMEDVQLEPQQDDDDNFVWDRCDVPEETVTYVAPEQGRGKAVDEDDADVESVYTTSDDDDLLEFEESDNEMDWD
ncbi:uncharacterized protein LOC113272978 [Papaver somniferum]|uniref:uncharacterized protein LOC113272978 n=1 Tax=Papaver somniferum TaxID=3469 RepID=UPI000E6FAF1F|nr:uncharacterized protein LOC113272978 [Papaver somniferum]